jgi:hypothetical protein
MMTWMREGGFSMFLILIAAAVTAAVAATRPKGRQADVLFAGAIATLAAGMFGVSTGLQAVAANYQRFPEPLAALATGLRELSYNGVFSAAVAIALAAAGLVVRRAPEAQAR